MQSQTQTIAAAGDDYLHINRYVLAALLKCEAEGLDEERALARIAGLLDELEDFGDVESVDVLKIRNGDHDRAKARGDEVVVDLLRPITHGKEQITTLTFRAPTLADIQASADARRKGQAMGKMLARCCGRTENELATMHVADVLVCNAALAFLQEGR